MFLESVRMIATTNWLLGLHPPEPWAKINVSCMATGVHNYIFLASTFLLIYLLFTWFFKTRFLARQWWHML